MLLTKGVYTMKIVQNFQGSYFGVKNVSSVNDVDWHDLKSEDFKNSLTGDPLPAGLAFFDMAVMSSPFNDGNTTNSYIKLRAKTLANYR
jgi:recombinational DNA repair protein RecR